MKNTFWILCAALLLSACGTESTDNQTSTEDVRFSQQAALICEEGIVGENDVPNASVFLVVGENKFKVADINVCAPISSEEYIQYQIPAESISAAGGWFAGFGEYLYAMQETEKIVVFQGTVDEMDETTDYGYTPIAEYENGSLKLLQSEE